MLAPVTDLLLLGVACGSVALTLTRKGITAPIRAALVRWPMVHEVASCPYCMAHWVGFAAALTLGGSWLGYVLNAFIIIGIATAFQGLVQRLWLMQEAEIERLRDLLTQAHVALKEHGY